MPDVRREIERLGARIIGPVRPTRQSVSRYVDPTRIDAAVIDLRLKGEEIFGLAEQLQFEGIPFVFALPEHHGDGTGNHPGFVLSSERRHLQAITQALFGGLIGDVH